jgi:hypothetical protein
VGHPAHLTSKKARNTNKGRERNFPAFFMGEESKKTTGSKGGTSGAYATLTKIRFGQVISK